MPIMDYDGTANYTIGIIYDYDGTANNQIGKVYDYDGTANYLIYNTEMNALIEATFDSTTTGGSTVSQTSSSLILTGYYTTSNSDNAGYALAYIPINFDDYSQVTVAYSITGNYNRHFSFGFSTDLTTSVSATDSTAMSATYNTGVYANYDHNDDDTTTSGAVTLSLSDLSGSGYFKAMVVHSSTADKGLMTLTQILFE